MSGSFTYGPFGRFLSIVAAIVAVSAHLEARGVFNLLPARYKWIGTALTVFGIIVTTISERAQGGASNPQVRDDAAQADVKNAAKAKEQEIDLHDINC